MCRIPRQIRSYRRITSPRTTDGPDEAPPNSAFPCLAADPSDHPDDFPHRITHSAHTITHNPAYSQTSYLFAVGWPIHPFLIHP